jgi:hypothetical protein
MNSALRKLSSKSFLPGAPPCSTMGRLFGQFVRQSPVQSSEARPRAGAQNMHGIGEKIRIVVLHAEPRLSGRRTFPTHGRDFCGLGQSR